jgi:hypothetical protein
VGTPGEQIVSENYRIHVHFEKNDTVWYALDSEGPNKKVRNIIRDIIPEVRPLRCQACSCLRLSFRGG